MSALPPWLDMKTSIWKATVLDLHQVQGSLRRPPTLPVNTAQLCHQPPCSIPLHCSTWVVGKHLWRGDVPPFDGSILQTQGSILCPQIRPPDGSHAPSWLPPYNHVAVILACANTLGSLDVGVLVPVRAYVQCHQCKIPLYSFCAEIALYVRPNSRHHRRIGVLRGKTPGWCPEIMQMRWSMCALQCSYDNGPCGQLGEQMDAGEMSPAYPRLMI